MRRAGVFLGLTLLFASGIWLFEPDRLSLQTATINWTDVRQTIDGFGGSSADFLSSLTPAQADFFFTPAGIGLSILRTQIIPDLATCDAEFRKGGCSQSNGQILSGELETAKLAVARGAIVFATPWSPPGAYKSNGSFKNGGSLLPSHYSDWAKDIATYVTMMATNDVPLYAVSVQNEPDLSRNYGSCQYTARQIHDFVPYLDTALHSAGAAATKIMIAEQSSWSLDLSSAAMADPNVASQIGILAAHGYAGRIQPYRTGSARLWQTEDSSQSPVYDGSMADGLSWAVKIHNYLDVANVNAWLWWFLTDMPNQGEGTDNAALTDIKGHFPKRAYITGQWSKFVRPGWSRIEVGYHFGPSLITAFKAPHDQSFAIVVVNSSTHGIAQTFQLKGFSSRSVTPWTTSEKFSLQMQDSIAVNGERFTYTLPPSSVTTFFGTATRPN